MNFNNIYIDENLINIIYNNLILNDKVNFSSINKYSYNNYKGVNKTRIYEYIYINYELYKKALKRFNYSQNELLNITKIVINEISIIKEKKLGSFQTNCIYELYNHYYDLRYIFELILNGLNTNDKELNNIIMDTNFLNKNITQSTLLFLINTIKNNISFSITETMCKIHNEPCLRTLHKTFKPIKI